jgi:hypothetical protein
MILPIIVISYYYDDHLQPWREEDAFSEGFVITASTGILSRLILRSSLSTAIRMELGANIQTSSRIALRTIFAYRGLPLTKEVLFKFTQNLFSQQQGVDQPVLKDFFLMIITWITLMISFNIVTYLIEGELYIFISTLIFIPLVTVFSTEQIASKLLNVQYDYFYTKDGFIVQMIFSLGMSFIPLANDTYVWGDKRNKGLVALMGWACLLVLALWIINFRWVLPADIFFWLLNFTLLFLLVLSIPVSPMEGYDIFKWNKLISMTVLLAALTMNVLFMDLTFTRYI